MDLRRDFIQGFPRLRSGVMTIPEEKFFHAQDKFPGAEGFHDIIIRAQFQPEHAVYF